MARTISPPSTAAGSAAAALLMVFALSACSTPAPPAAGPSPAATSSPAATPPPTPAVQVPMVASTLAPSSAEVPPVQVRIDAIGIDVPVIPVGVEPDGAMEIPPDPAIAGWYKFGPTPATGTGNTVLAAHIDSPEYPIGPFASLRDVPAGAEVAVSSADGAVARYSVQTVTYYPKAELPTDALFARVGAPTLVLVTCGGEFDSSTGHYRDNVVLVATLIA